MPGKHLRRADRIAERLGDPLLQETIGGNNEHSLTGGCQCGAVRHECFAEPLFTGNCHCRDCQKATGGAYTPAFAVPAEAVKITGKLK